MKGKDKGKSKDLKDYSKVADGRGKGKGLPADVCKLCGGRGHWSRECPVRNLRQVSQDAASTVATQSLVSSGSGQETGGGQGVQGSPTTVARRVTYFDPDDEAHVDEPYITMVALAETYDMTYSDSDSDWRLCKGVQRGGEVYFEDFTDASVETYGKTGDGSTPAVIRGAYEQVSQVRGKLAIFGERVLGRLLLEMGMIDSDLLCGWERQTGQTSMSWQPVMV